MATGTHAGSTWNTTAGNKTVVATPALNDLIVVVHGISTWASGDNSVITDNNSDGLGTYTRYGTASAPLSTGGGTSCAAWISIRNALIGSATSTTFTATNTGDTGGGLTVMRFSDMSRTGASAPKQAPVGESDQTESPPAIAFGAATNTNNPIVLAVMTGEGGNKVPPTDFSEATDATWSTPTTGVEVCWVNSGKTASSYTWTSGGGTDHNEVGVELDSSVDNSPQFSAAARTMNMNQWVGRQYV
jgi:hypothetical protein